MKIKYISLILGMLVAFSGCIGSDDTVPYVYDTNVTGLVPYTGASQNVDLGTKNLTAGNITVNELLLAGNAIKIEGLPSITRITANKSIGIGGTSTVQPAKFTVGVSNTGGNQQTVFGTNGMFPAQSATEPTCYDGLMYYNTTLHKLKLCESGTWKIILT